MRRMIALVCAAVLCPFSVHAQGVLGELLSGELVNPRVGAWAWYDLKDAATGQEFLVRMAIVDQEKAGDKDGYWFELEIVPKVGFRSVYKMLLTGPASDPANIHKMICREGTNEPKEVPVDAAAGDADKAPEPEKKSRGKEEVETAAKTKVSAERYELASKEGKTQLWLNEEVRPMGLVKLKSPKGELLLRNNGVGGDEARSVIDQPPVSGAPKEDVKVEVSVDKNPKRVQPKKADKPGSSADEKAKK